MTEPHKTAKKTRKWTGRAQNRSIPICCDDYSTPAQAARSLNVSRLTLPLFEIARQAAFFGC
jgi:hypothetical protein